MKIKMKLLYLVKLQVFFVKLVNSKLFLSTFRSTGTSRSSNLDLSAAESGVSHATPIKQYISTISEWLS